MANFYDRQIDKMNHLMFFGSNKETKNESTVYNQKEGADGKIYGIVKEGTKYYIKSCEKGKENLVESFDYASGYLNKKADVYSSYADAVKDMNMKLMSLNEDYQVSLPINEAKPNKFQVMDDSMLDMQSEIARFKGIMENIDKIYANKKSGISDRNVGVPEAPKTSSFEPDKNGPFTEKADYEENRDKKENAKDYEKQGNPFEEDGGVDNSDMQSDALSTGKGETVYTKKAEYVPQDCVAAMHPAGGKVVRVNEEIEDDEEIITDETESNDPIADLKSAVDSLNAADEEEPIFPEGTDPYSDEEEPEEEEEEEEFSAEELNEAATRAIRNLLYERSIATTHTNVRDLPARDRIKGSEFRHQYVSPDGKPYQSQSMKNFSGLDTNPDGSGSGLVYDDNDDLLFNLDLESGENMEGAQASARQRISDYSNAVRDVNRLLIRNGDEPLDLNKTLNLFTKGIILYINGLQSLSSECDIHPFVIDAATKDKNVANPMHQEVQRDENGNIMKTKTIKRGKETEEDVLKSVRDVHKIIPGLELKHDAGTIKGLDYAKNAIGDEKPITGRTSLAQIGLVHQDGSEYSFDEISDLCDALDKWEDRHMNAIDAMEDEMKKKENLEYIRSLSQNPEIMAKDNTKKVVGQWLGLLYDLSFFDRFTYAISSVYNAKELQANGQWDAHVAKYRKLEKDEEEAEKYDREKEETFAQNLSNVSDNEFDLNDDNMEQIINAKMKGENEPRKRGRKSKKAQNNADLSDSEVDALYNDALKDDEDDAINEDVLHVFGQHPGYRKKPMTHSRVFEIELNDTRDWDDESAKGEEPFGKKIGDGKPFSIKKK